MRLFYLECGHPEDGEAMRTWLVVAASAAEAERLLPLPWRASCRVEDIRELAASQDRTPGIIGWMGPSVAAAGVEPPPRR